MTNPHEHLTVAEVADICRVTPDAVRKWLRAGKLPAVRIGERALRIRRSDLEAFIEPATFPAAGLEDGQ